MRVVQRVGPKRERQLVGPHRAHAGEATSGVRHEHLHERHRVGVRAEVQVGEQAGGELALFEAEEPAQSRVAVGHDPEMEAAAGNDEPPTLGIHEPGPAVGEFVGGGDIVREMFDGSLRAGRYVLENIGLSDYEAAQAEQTFYHHDRTAVRELAELWIPGMPTGENKKYIDRARQLEKDLETELLELAEKHAQKSA